MYQRELLFYFQVLEMCEIGSRRLIALDASMSASLQLRHKDIM